MNTARQFSSRSDGLLTKILEHPKIKPHIKSGPDSRGDYTVWCPFHPDGEGKPPHQANLKVGPRGFICHACGKKGSLLKLAKLLGIPVAQNQEDPEKTYNYTDERGELLYQVARFPEKRFLQRQPDGNSGWIWNLRGVRRVLYRLPELVAKRTEPVFIVEGEKDADRLAGAGLLATTNSGGAAANWRQDYNEVLKNRDVVILPDNDEPGRKHAIDVAASVKGMAASVKVVELPGLPDSGDVSDWLDAGHTIEHLQTLVETAVLWKPRADEEQATTSKRSKRTGIESQAGILARLVMQAGVELFYDERGQPYAVVPVPNSRRVMAIDSNDFERWTSRQAWTKLETTPSRESLASALRVISAKACFDSPQHKLDVRCTWHEDAIWIDLDGQRAVKVTPGKWEIVEKPPILFRSFPHQKPLPEPVSGGDPWQILHFTNLREPDDEVLFMCFLVAAFVPDIPIPALLVHGVQGSAKTTLLKVVKGLLDPSGVEVRGGVRDQTEFAQAAFQNRVLFFDNLTHVPDWLSDALCMTITGGGWSKRKLYTDEESVYFQYKRVVGLSGINLVADRGDLLDRSIILSLEPVGPDQRKAEKDFWQDYEKDRPCILGGIFDALAQAMALTPELELPLLPRMADFAHWGAAAAQALGRTPRDFITAYDRNVGRQNEAALEASPVGQAVLSFMESSEQWNGTAAELLAKLEPVAEGLHIDTKSKYWPGNPTWVTRRLKEVHPNLLAMGVEILVEAGTPRKITLRKTGPPANTDEPDCTKDTNCTKPAIVCVGTHNDA